MTQTYETDVQTGRAKTTTANVEPSGFVWYELHTPDVATAAAFYEPVLGWATRDAGVPNRRYALVCVGETPIGGLLEKPAAGLAAGDKARWVGYIGVHDVRQLSRRVQEAGGIVHRAAEEISGVGTFAVVADPQGAIFVLFQPPPGMTRPEQPDALTLGMPAWHELAAIDWRSDFEFYAELFGWTKGQAFDMGPDSVYQLFAVAGRTIGGMMTLPSPAQGSGWMFYFQVEELEAAIDRVKENGGLVVYGPSVVPGGQQIAHCLDKQGASFGMVGS